MRDLALLSAIAFVFLFANSSGTVADSPVVSRIIYVVDAVQLPDAKILRGQDIAQKRANYMARNNRKGHPPKSAGNQWSIKGANFEGVGWRSNSNVAKKTIGTCRPSGRSGSQDDNSRSLLGDAVAHSRYGSFRVRIWGRK